MGLDVYVGSFTRYYCQDWQLITQQLFGQSVLVVRPQENDDAGLPSREEVLAAVRAWRDNLNQRVPNH